MGAYADCPNYVNCQNQMWIGEGSYGYCSTECKQEILEQGKYEDNMDAYFTKKCVNHTGPEHPKRSDCVYTKVKDTGREFKHEAYKRYRGIIMKRTKREQQREDYRREAEVKQFYTVHNMVTEIEKELIGALKEFPPMASYHEGYAIIKEEVDELWDEVKRSKTDQYYKERGYDQIPVVPKQRMKEEAIQIAAMAARFAMELCNE